MLVYSPSYNTDLRKYGFDKPFALDRGQMVLDALQQEYGRAIPYLLPEAISLEDAGLIHSRDYLESLKNDESWREIFELKEEDLLPPGNYEPLHNLLGDILLKSGGTLLACRKALETGLAANLGGGYHHAFPDQGRGFCVLNDIAISITKLRRKHLVERVIIVDLDFHQGDGTAYIFRNDPDVFTLSVHSQEGWPDEKQESDLDVPVYSEETELYLEKTTQGIDQALSSFDPQLCLFVAGSDPYELDILPGTRFLRLSLERLRQRDELVINRFHDLKIPLAMVFAGGYGPDVWRVHHQAVRHLLLKSGILAQ
ncbi:MAG: histone deacetylase [Candidatus Obscuribacterales bacterium]|nr:histone deacetylase [Candidatus Obscuribacterales bacterium]